MRPCKLSPFRLSLFLAIATAFSFSLTGIAQETAQVSPPVASRIVTKIDESSLVTLAGTRHPLANAKNDRGAAPESMPLERLHLVLKRSDSQEAGLRQLINDMHTPGTASYHKWLTPDQFGQQFGPSDQDVAAVETWLTQHGFSVNKVNPGRQTVEFTGNVAQLRNAFHTQIHQYEVNGETHYANANDPKIPAALAPVVGGFAALNNFRMHSNARVMGKATYDPKTDKANPLWTWGDNSGVNFVLSPADYAVQYDLNPLYNATPAVDGTGQSIAVIDYSNVNVGVVNQFRTLFGLPFNPPQVIVDGNDPGIDGINNPDGAAPGTAVESYLDVEWAGAIAPKATIYLVVAADTALEGGGFLAAERAVYGNVAPIISSSIFAYGCEQEAGSSNAFISGLWEQAAAQGITVLEASGDSGSAGCDSDSRPFAENGLGVNNWASTPYNVAVGGTDFYYSDYNATSTVLNNQLATYWNGTPTQTPAVSLLQPIPEQPWNDSQYGLDTVDVFQLSGATTIAGGSGGASNCATGTGSDGNSGWATCTAGYPKPAWQTGITGIPNDGVRDLPDLSLFASDGTNFSFYPVCADDGDCQAATGSNIVQLTGVGGTSASTPAFAGIMALINQKYGPQGQADFVLYPLKKQFPAAFHDVTHGTNSVPCSAGSINCIPVTTNPITYMNTLEGQLGTGNTPDYNAAAGYNLATGLGTVDANVMVNDWNKVTFKTSSTTLTPSKTSFAHGTAITVSGNVTTTTGQATGDVALMASTPETSQQGQTFFTLSSGAYSGQVNTLPGGTYNIWGQYGGDSANGPSSSTPVKISVTPEASGIFFNLFQIINGQFLYVDTSTTHSFFYGAPITLSALTAPSSQLSAFENCELNGGTCPTFTFPTGTVTFSDGGTALNTAVINAEGEAEYTLPATYNVGTHTVTASYSGDASYNASNSSSITFSVTSTAPTVYVTSPSPTYTKGQTSTLTVMVEGFANGTAPAGTVAISGAPSGTPASATLSAGIDPIYGVTVGLATVTIPATAPTGSYSVKATYTPNGTSVGNYTGTTSIAYPLTITASAGIATTTTGSASASATSPTAPVIVTGTVTAASGAAPTGTVQVLLGGLDPNTGGANGVTLELTQVSLTPGSGKSSTFGFSANSQQLIQGANQLTLQYLGNSSDAPSTALVTIANPLSDFSLVPTATNLPINVSSGAASGTVSVNVTSYNSFAGAVNLTCTATAGVTCTIPASVSLTSGSTAKATLTINAPAGTTSKNYDVLVTGMDSTGKYVHTASVQAVVSGASTTPNFTLAANPTTLNLTAGATTGNSSIVTVAAVNGFTGTVGLTCTVAPAGPICALASPSVASGSGTDVVTVTTTSATATGAYVVTVTGSSGSLNHTAAVTVNVSAAPVPDFTLTANPTTLNLTAGATTGNSSTVTVAAVNGFTGTVGLTCTVAPAGPTCAPASPSVASGSGTDVVTVTTTSATTAGAYVVTVTGSSGALTHTATVTVNVAAAPIGNFAISSSGGITVAPGATTGNASTITVTPSGGFTGAISLACSISPAAASDPATCSFTPSSTVTITGASAQTATVTVGTTAPTSALNRPKDRDLFWPSAGGAALALVFFFGIPARKRNWPALLGLLVLFVSVGAIGCGGGSSGGGGHSNPGTTAGTYTVTISATATGFTAQTTTVTLTVQ